MEEAALARIVASRASLSRSVCARQPRVDEAMASQRQNMLTADMTSSESYSLTVVQQPEQGKVYQKKDKGRGDLLGIGCRLTMADRKPIEPPPVVELTINDNDPLK